MSYDVWKDAGDEPQHEYSSSNRRSPSSFRSGPKPQNREAVSRSKQREIDVRRKKSEENQTRPADVSEYVWGIVQEWWDLGCVALGTNPVVRRSEFSRILSKRINQDPDVRKMLRPEELDPETRRYRAVRLSEEDLATRKLQVNEILSLMSRKFWEQITNGDRPSDVQHRYFEDWDDLWYRAEQSIEVSRILKGLTTNETTRRPANYKMVDPEKVQARKSNRTIKRYLREHPDEKHPDHEPLTDEQRAEFAQWLAERNQTRDNVAN